VALWDGNAQIASVLANGSRGDVGAVLGDNGLHAYNIPIPSGYANGVSHTVQVRYEASATQLPVSPVTINCGGAATLFMRAGWTRHPAVASAAGRRTATV